MTCKLAVVFALFGHYIATLASALFGVHTESFYRFSSFNNIARRDEYLRCDIAIHDLFDCIVLLFALIHRLCLLTLVTDQNIIAILFMLARTRLCKFV